MPEAHQWRRHDCHVQTSLREDNYVLEVRGGLCEHQQNVTWLMEGANSASIEMYK
jgi:hypothetical protein